MCIMLLYTGICILVSASGMGQKLAHVNAPLGVISAAQSVPGPRVLKHF